VQPVAIRYSSAAAAWVGDDNLVSHIWRTLRMPPLRCVISFAPPLDYRESSNRKTVALLARETILDMISASSAGPQADLAVSVAHSGAVNLASEEMR
jgi:1-acyl-sn-glycerol-3-phosphate acyltransferase